MKTFVPIFRHGGLLALAIAAGVAVGRMHAAGAGIALPPGYHLLYAQTFDEPAALEEFAMTDPHAWKLSGNGSHQALELFTQSHYKPSIRSPFNIALIADKIFGDFILEADLLSTAREYGHRDMCLFFGFQDPSHFYYVHMATHTDPHAHNIFIVNDKPRLKISEKTTEGVDWGHNAWHHVRLVRHLEDGLIQVYFDDMSRPIMVAHDKTFGAGYIGFGSFDDTGKIDNIKIWGPSLKSKPLTFFKRP